MEPPAVPVRKQHSESPPAQQMGLVRTLHVPAGPIGALYAIHM